MTTHDDHPRNDLALAEAALFLAPQPLTRRALAKILGGVALAYADQLLEDLKAQFDDPSRGIELHIEDGRAMFRVKAAYVNQVAHLAPQQDIPRPELRTLAVIAYNHPMTQANLIKVRGNKGYRHVQELIERHLITAEPHGRTLLLSVTKDFLRHFGLSNVEEFRFHFSASPEEESGADSAEPSDQQSDPIGVGDVAQSTDPRNDGLGIPSVETAYSPQSQEADEGHESLAADRTDVGDAPQSTDPEGEDPEAPSDELVDDHEPQEAGEEGPESLVSNLETVETEDEPKEEPAEEVEDG